MKFLIRTTSVVAALAASGAASADVIYSNLQNIVIPTSFDGTYIDVDGLDGWDMNPFFGGVGVANTALFQPVRTGTGILDPLRNFAAGTTVDATVLLSSGYGGSQTHLGETFTAGQEGYFGFKLNGNFGWLRVVFTANTAGAMVLDWAYENSGQPITVGRVHQSQPVAGVQTFALSPGLGESFTLGSVISDTGGYVSRVVKTGTGTTVLTGINPYTGVTAVIEGRLVVDGNISGSSITVGGGATLGGSGYLGSTTISGSGTLAPGGSIGTMNISGDLMLEGGSSCEFEINGATNAADLAIVTGNIYFGGTLSVTNLGGSLGVGQRFGIFDWTGEHSGAFAAINLPALDDGLTWDQTELYTAGSISIVPEAEVIALACLGQIILLRRRRSA